MSPLWQIVLTPVAVAVVFGVGVLSISRRIDGPDRPIVVVDRRTYRLARSRINDALDEHDLARAHAGIEATRKWLRRQLHTGPAAHRVEYASALEAVELQAEEAGLPLSP